VSELQQQSLEGAIVALTALAAGFTDDQYVRARLASARHDLQEHLAMVRWTAFIEDHHASVHRTRFTLRHKARRGADHA
jgi:hypothetical protein